jgi:hypothetical protein
MAAAWDAFWFTPAPALNLAAARIVFALHAIWILGSRDLAAISGVPDVFWAGVPAADRWRYLLFPGHASLESVLQTLTCAALLAAVLGIVPRLACLSAALLLYHLAPLETIFWTPNPFERGFTVSTLVLFVLGLSRSGDALRFVRRSRAEPPPSADYQWPLKLIQIFTLQVYFIAGWAKLYRTGVGWASADNLRAWMLSFAQQDQVWVVSGLTQWVADRPLICGAIGVSALLLDLGLITIVLWPRLRAWLIAIALGFHAGILLTMGILFLNVPQFLVFVDWAALRARRRARESEQVRPQAPAHFRPAEGPEQAV